MSPRPDPPPYLEAALAVCLTLLVIIAFVVPRHAAPRAPIPTVQSSTPEPECESYTADDGSINSGCRMSTHTQVGTR